jgi:hypothetical protein
MRQVRGARVAASDGVVPAFSGSRLALPARLAAVGPAADRAVARRGESVELGDRLAAIVFAVNGYYVRSVIFSASYSRKCGSPTE